MAHYYDVMMLSALSESVGTNSIPGLPLKSSKHFAYTQNFSCGRFNFCFKLLIDYSSLFFDLCLALVHKFLKKWIFPDFYDEGRKCLENASQHFQ